MSVFINYALQVLSLCAHKIRAMAHNSCSYAMLGMLEVVTAAQKNSYRPDELTRAYSKFLVALKRAVTTCDLDRDATRVQKAAVQTAFTLVRPTDLAPDYSHKLLKDDMSDWPVVGTNPVSNTPSVYDSITFLGYIDRVASCLIEALPNPTDQVNARSACRRAKFNNFFNWLFMF